MSTGFRYCLASGVLAGLFATFPAGAGADSYPTLSGEVAIEVQDDWTYHSEDRDNELNDLFTKTEPTLVTHFTREFSLTLHGVLEPIRDPGPRDDRVFDDQGLYVEDLYLSYDRDRFSIQGGKFTPNFGIAWDAAPGIYGTDVAEDYEFSERIGFGGAYAFDGKAVGTHTVSASLFFMDTSILSESVLANRPRVRRADGGAGNTEELTSFAIGLDGEEIPGLTGLAYHLALIRQAEGVDGNSDELGYAIALSQEMTLGKDVGFNPLIEYVYFDDSGGISGDDKSYLTAAGELTWRDWNLALAYTWRHTDPAGTADVDDHQFQVSAGYTFPIGIGVNVGGKIVEEAGIRSEVAGFLIDYTIEF